MPAAPPRRRLLAAQQDAAQAAAAEDCKLKLDSVAVELDFTVQKNQPAAANNSKPMFKIEGAMVFAYPCKHGDTAEANAKLELNIGEFSVPDFTVEMVFYCGVDGGATEPVFELKGFNEEAMVLGPVTVEQLELELVAYTYAEEEETVEESQEPEKPPAADADEPAAGPGASLGWAPAAAPAADADAEAPGASATNDTDTNTTGKKPIHVAGILSGYITVNLTSAQLGHPALLGLAPEQVPGLAESTLPAKATFSFDSRTNTFSMSAEIRYEDECVLVILQAAASNKCGAGQVMSVMGTITLKPACNTEGFGKVSGLRHCSDGEDAAGYELTAEAWGSFRTMVRPMLNRSKHQDTKIYLNLVGPKKQPRCDLGIRFRPSELGHFPTPSVYITECARWRTVPTICAGCE